jgi:enoyl-CoA hydratase
MGEPVVSIEKGLGPEGRIGLVRLDRGDKINALSPEVMRQLRRAALAFEDDTTTSVVVVTGNAQVFSGGFDLKDTEAQARLGMGLGERRAGQRLGPRMCQAWWDMEQVTIAAIEGPCIGGGAALAASLEFRICGTGAHFRIPEVALGMNMSWARCPSALVCHGARS